MLKAERDCSQPAKVEMKVEHLAQLEEQLAKEHQLPLSSYRDGCIKRRLSARIQSLGLKSLSQYLDLLKNNPQEEKKLIDSLTISVTSFFRDPETFRQIAEKVVPVLLGPKRKPDPQIQLWSAGCSTGEEAYSLAITFVEALPDKASAETIRILATDIDEQAVQQASKGVYSRDRLKNLNRSLIRKYFVARGESCEVKPELKSRIAFRRENLLAPEFVGFKEMDLIMCRNLLIYLQQEEQARILGNFERSLRGCGYLVLGKTEFLPDPYRSRFEHISSAERIFRKIKETGARAYTGGIG